MQEMEDYISALAREKRAREEQRVQQRKEAKNGIHTIAKLKVKMNKEKGTYEYRLPDREFIVAEVRIHPDMQLINDHKMLYRIALVLSMRYKLIQNSKRLKLTDAMLRGDNVVHGIWYWQTGVSEYEFRLMDGTYLTKIVLPTDMNFQKDLVVIYEICKALSERYGVDSSVR